MLKRNGLHEFHTHENHAHYPEIDNVAGRGEDSCRIKDLELSCFFRPTKSSKRPEGRAKPGVEHVFILSQVFALAFGTACRRLFKSVDSIASGASPNGDAVTPPELAADVPISNVFHPIKIG